MQTQLKFDVYNKQVSKVGVVSTSAIASMYVCIITTYTSIFLSLPQSFFIPSLLSSSLSQMCSIGQAHCCVSDLIRSPDQSCRLEVMFDNATCGYLHIKAWKVSTNQQQSCQIMCTTCALICPSLPPSSV